MDIKKLARKNILNINAYEPGKPLEELQRELGIGDIIKMASNENPLGPSPCAIEAVKNIADGVNLYPDGNGYYLREAIAGRYSLKRENVILGNGSNEIIELTVRCFLNEGEEVVISRQAFVVYDIVVKIMNGVIKAAPMKNYTHDLTAMAKAITDKTKLIFIANPNNPTGTMVNSKEAASFMKDIPENIIVIFDEAYYEYVTAEDWPDTLKYLNTKKNIIILRTFSKMYGLAGLRVGYGLARENIINLMQTVRQPFNVNAVAQKAALAALDDKSHLLASKKVNDDGKKYLYSEFKNLGLEFIASQTNFVLVKIPMAGRELFKKMLKKGVIIRAMDIYGLKEFVRITIGKKEDNERFIKAFKECLEL
jgi:histidinol-phosphate aminotransferase